MKRLMRGFIGLAGLIVASMMAVAGYAYISAYLALPSTSGDVRAEGLSAPVTITRDEHGVPWIEANSAADAYFALGYVHAQDRFFQMEMMRRLGQGRLAEILGPLGVNSDRFMRTLGLYRRTLQAIPSMDADTLSMAKAYSLGVNAFLNTPGNHLPLELRLLFITPEPWQIADSMVWQKLMGLQLSGNWPDELSRAAVIAKLGPERAADLWPDAASASPVTLVGLSEKFVTDLRSAMLSVVTPTLASNIWAVAGTRTDTGSPFLANDPHLGFQSPNLWYLAGISYPGLRLIGATTPGVPLHLLGHNGSVAWGFTTTHGDTQDLFVETVSDDDMSYRTPEGWQPFETREETIHVRFGAPQKITVRSTRHGPIVSDILPEGDLGAANLGGKAVALSATLLAEDDHSVDALFRMARAASAQEFIAAARRFHAPQQNVMFADHESIGWLSAGLIPLRKDAACDGLLPADGASGACDWVGWAPFDLQPQSLNPASGELINANNKIVPDDYPVMVAKEWHEGYRAQRIADVLADRTDLTLDDMAALQADQVSLMAEDLLPLLLNRLSPELRKDPLIEQLSSWNGDTSSGRSEPLAFALWMENLKARLIGDELGDQKGELWGARPALMKSILKDKTVWCDDTATTPVETCEMQVAAAWRDAKSWLDANATPAQNGERWGRWHVARFNHLLFGNIPGLSWLGRISAETGGDDYTVNRGTFAPSTAAIPFRHRHGPGYRAVYDLADLNRSLFGIAGGQSGHVLSPHFADLEPDWAKAKLFPMVPPAADGRPHLLLTPSP